MNSFINKNFSKSSLPEYNLNEIQQDTVISKKAKQKAEKIEQEQIKKKSGKLMSFGGLFKFRKEKQQAKSKEILEQKKQTITKEKQDQSDEEYSQNTTDYYDDMLRDGRQSVDLFLEDSFKEIDLFVEESAGINNKKVKDIAKKLKKEEGFSNSLTFSKEIQEESEGEQEFDYTRSAVSIIKKKRIMDHLQQQNNESSNKPEVDLDEDLERQILEIQEKIALEGLDESIYQSDLKSNDFETNIQNDEKEDTTVQEQTTDLTKPLNLDQEEEEFFKIGHSPQIDVNSKLIIDTDSVQHEKDILLGLSDKNKIDEKKNTEKVDQVLNLVLSEEILDKLNNPYAKKSYHQNTNEELEKELQFTIDESQKRIQQSENIDLNDPETSRIYDMVKIDLDEVKNYTVERFTFGEQEISQYSEPEAQYTTRTTNLQSLIQQNILKQSEYKKQQGPRYFIDNDGTVVPLIPVEED